jgi:NAD(P)-dependent dehydrogenase (short-subunit alcohol dehydrogenase family)
MTTTLVGKTAVVTGATNGIGEVTARTLAHMGARVIGVGRNSAKCTESAERIQRETGNPQVEYLVADLSLSAQVRQLADTLLNKLNRLDVLVNNVGGVFAQRIESAEGIEMTWALNHLSYFQLTNRLLDALKASPAARVVNVSSVAHRLFSIRFDDIQFKIIYSGFPAYGHSKLANVMFTYELARRLEGTTVTANVLHPGFVSTGFGVSNGGFRGAFMRLIQRFGARTPEQGAQTSIYLASSPNVQGVTGKYFTDQRAVKSSAASYDLAAAARLWALSEEMVA